MYCHKCGKKVSGEDNFCNNCGAKIENNEVIKNDQTKLKQVNSVKNKRTILIVGITLGIFIVSCLGVTYFKFKNKSENINTLQSVETLSENSIDDNVPIKSEETPDSTKETHKEKEVFAKLLKSTKWLTENTDYAKIPQFIKFLVLDINQDGTCEMMLYHGDSGGLAGLTLSIVSYNVNEDKINAQKINVGHGGYSGYLNNEKTIVVGGGSQGSSYTAGYKQEGDKYIKEFFTFDNASGSAKGRDIVYTLNDNNVSKEKYNEFLDSINNNITYTEMYLINDENIKNVLGIDPNTIVEDSIDKYSTLRFKTAGQAKDWLLTQDNTFINNKNLYIKESNDNEIINLFSQHFVLEKDDYYLFDAYYKKQDIGESDPMRYLVGKHTGNIYLIGPQPTGYAYLIKNNQVIEKLKYDNKESHDWRELMS